MSLDKIIDELQFLSNRISEQTRTISLSVLALVWLFFAGGNNSPILPSFPDKTFLYISGFLALSSLLTDYFQYLFAYFDSSNVRRNAEETNQKNAVYDYTSCLYKLRIFSFWFKQVLSLASVFCLAVALFKSL